MSESTTRKIPAPTIAPENRAYWEAAGEGRLLIRHCRACDRLHAYPRALCPWCFSADTDWVQASGRGTIYSYSIGTGNVPVIPAYVRLDEGITMLSNMVDCAPEQLHVGLKVSVTFVQADNGQSLPMFRPEGEK